MSTQRYFLSLLLLTVSIFVSAQSAQPLAGMLKQMRLDEEATPNNFYAHVLELRQMVQSEADATRRAVYSAALAHLLCENSHWAQTYRRNTQSHPDSVQEWSGWEYHCHAASLYRAAMAQKELLAKEKTALWQPLLLGFKSANVQPRDMLTFLWQSAARDLPGELFRDSLPSHSALEQFFLTQNKEAEAFAIVLDSVQANHHRSKASLHALIARYGKLDACAEVYLLLANLPNQEPTQRREVLQQGLDRYPKYWRRAALQNELLQLEEPLLSWRGQDLYYPAQETQTPLSVRNLTSATFSLYRLPANFNREQDHLPAAVRKSGHRIAIQQQTFKSTNQITTHTDTLHWTTPATGRYALIAEGKTNARLSHTPEPQVWFFNVSTLATFSTNLPIGLLKKNAPGIEDAFTMRQVVVDAMTGKPIADAQVHTASDSRGKIQELESETTNAHGIAQLMGGGMDWKNKAIQVGVSKGKDNALDARYANRSFHRTEVATQASTHIRLFTDRAIYRPGQVVHFSMLTFAHKGTEAWTKEGAKAKVECLDANRQALCERTLQSDAFGVAADSIVLPKHILPGVFTLRTANSSCSFRVEEYRRPTFQVCFDEAKPVQWPLDSVRISGTVKSYTDLPLANARIVGKYQWTSGLWHYINTPSREQQLDTLQTDTDGRFALTIPINYLDTNFRWGKRLQVDIDALSTYGETQHGRFSMPICSTPLRLRIALPEVQDRYRLKAWSVQLVGPDDKEINGNVQCQLLNTSGQAIFHTTLAAGSDTIPADLATLPSGRYHLRAEAIVGNDTARFNQQILLFGMDDHTAPIDTALWVYCPQATFSTQQPARIQIASSCNEAFLYATAPTQDAMAIDTLIALHAESRILEIPYQDTYGDGLELNIAMFSKGKFYGQKIRLVHQLPPRKLEVEWETFRNYLQPGEQEEWRLTLRNADGSPAQANVMCTLYDAALDALASHNLRFAFSPSAHIPSQSINPWHEDTPWRSLPFHIYQHRLPNQGAAYWNYALFNASMMAIEESAVLSGHNAKKSRAVLSTSAAPAMMKQMAVTNMADSATNNGAAETIAQAEGAEEEKAEQDANEPEPDNVELRSDMTELAFFRPNLRSDEQGKLCIAFTLPQGLTTWHLLGMAHTQSLSTAQLNRTLVARKELMAALHLPRYLRAGDKMEIRATLQSLAPEAASAEAWLEVSDASTHKTLLKQHLKAIALAPQHEQTFSFMLHAPQNCESLVFTWKAKTAHNSDGEQRALAVLSNEEVITETKAFHIHTQGPWQMDLNKLFAHNHPSATARNLAVEYTARPIWLALQALPSMVDNKADDALSTASALYALTMARHISQSVPNLREAIAQWEQEPFQGTLHRNAELAQLLAAEMPWATQNEAELNRRQHLASLMADASSPSSLVALCNQLYDLQQSDGLFAWWPGMWGSTYITERVLTLLTRMEKIAPQQDQPEASNLRKKMIRQGIEPLYKQLIRASKDRKIEAQEVVPFLQIVHLSGIDIPSHMKSKVADWTKLLAHEAPKMARQTRAQAALILHAASHTAEAQKLLPELRRVLTQPDGYYLAYRDGIHWGINPKIENHTLVMETFATLAPQDTALINGMQQWLLMQKRTQNWQLPIHTADAIHALVQCNAESLADNATDHISIADKRGKRIDLQSPESALGYLRTNLDIDKPAQLHIDKQSTGLSWGAVYASYRIPIGLAEAQREGISIRRETSCKGKTQVGSRITLRLTLTVDNDMQFVCLSSPRIAAAEPAESRSGIVYTSNLRTYRAVRDARTDYFFDSLPRGTYILEEQWLLTAAGTYQLAPATLRSVYAPECQAHTEGNFISVEKE